MTDHLPNEYHDGLLYKCVSGFSGGVLKPLSPSRSNRSSQQPTHTPFFYPVGDHLK